MVNLRLLSSALALASIMTVSAQSTVPGSPTLSMSFEIVEDAGKVVGTVTAPMKDNQWQELPQDTKIDIRVVRSCYALSETNVAVFTVSDLAPGESRNFTDNAEPAWQYGYQYTYNAFASIDGAEGYQGYGSCEPGIPFQFGYNTVTATPAEEDGKFFVDIAALIPDKTSSYPIEPLEIEMEALEVYRVTNASTGEMELIGSVPKPVKGETCHFIDKNPVLNSLNIYQVKCVSKFGAAQVRTEAFVGYDVPADPYPVSGKWLDDGGYKVTWTAPEKGKNNGAIDPAKTTYNVYRVWGRADDQKEKIADSIKALEYVDYGTDMEVPRAVMYMVEALNEYGVGGSSSSSYDYDVVIGPDYRLPMIETFDGGASKIWTFGYTSYYAQFNVSEYAEYGDDYKRVEPVSGTGLAYVDFSLSYISAGSSATMTSYKIDMSKAVAPYLSFYVYMIPGCDVVVRPQISVEGGEYVQLSEIKVGDCEKAEWKKVVCSLADYAGKGYVNVRFYGGFTSKRAAAIIDEIKIVDYPAVGGIEVAYDTEACSATLTWEDPSTEYAVVTGYEGVVDGKSVGEVKMPWVFKAADYRVPSVLSVRAVYGDITGPESAPVTVSVPRPVMTEFTIDNHLFSIVQGTEPEVNRIIVKEYLGNDALYKVPERVTYDEVTYDVVAIGEAAYRGNKSLVSVNMPATIAMVGPEAFSDCSNIMAVSFGAGLERIETKAFANCSSLASVVFVSESVPEVAADAFTGIASPCQGKCPEGMEDAYSKVEGLSPISFKTSGIGSMIVDDALEVEYYDFSGIRLTAPAAGTPVVVRALMPDGTFRIFRTIMR